jgi:hypothetical protein
MQYGGCPLLFIAVVNSSLIVVANWWKGNSQVL